MNETFRQTHSVKAAPAAGLAPPRHGEWANGEKAGFKVLPGISPFLKARLITAVTSHERDMKKCDTVL